MSAHRIGTIRYAGQKISEVVAAIRQACPISSIAVCTVTDQSVLAIARELTEAGISGITSGAEPQFRVGETRIGTMLAFARTIEKYDLVLFAGLPALRNKHLELPYSASERARKFVLLEGGHQLTSYDAYLARCYFGFSEFAVGPLGTLVRPLVASWLPTTTYERSPNHCQSASETMSRCIWTAPVRNRRIAALAKSLAGIEAGGEQYAAIEAAAAGCKADRTVVIYVETVEHAAAIASRLPDWPIVLGDNANLRGLSGGYARRLHAGRSKPANQCCLIVTAGGVDKVDWSRVNVLVRADGGSGGLPWLLDHLAVPEALGRPFLLADVRDYGHRLLAKRTAQRAAEYRRLGWFDAGRDPTTERLAAFVLRRLNLA